MRRPHPRKPKTRVRIADDPASLRDLQPKRDSLKKKRRPGRQRLSRSEKRDLAEARYDAWQERKRAKEASRARHEHFARHFAARRELQRQVRDARVEELEAIREDQIAWLRERSHNFIYREDFDKRSYDALSKPSQLDSIINQWQKRVGGGDAQSE